MYRGFRTCNLTLLLLLLTACASNVSRFQMPGTDLAAIDTLYMAGPGEEARDQELHRLLKGALEERGYTVVIDSQAMEFNVNDAIFEFSPDWHWDITWYLLELRVAIYEPLDKTLIAQAQSMQSTLVRKDAPIVVARAIASLFNDLPEEEGDTPL